ncbi:MAG: ATP-binding protein [Lentisphaeraceae bacterium]|nr:ATP-binding protein [Lentisphaeraceae bacterium]
MLEKHMDMYIKCCQKTMESMFNFHVNSNQIDYSIEIKEQYSPLNDTCVHIPFFGSISGEFFLSVDLNEWRYIVKNAIGLDDEEMVFSSLKESLNIIAGETISSISKEFPNLTYLSPRITIGKMYYPSVKTICAKVQMETLTTLDLGISVDLMQVELNEKLERSLTEVDEHKKQTGLSEKINVLGSLVEYVLQDLKTPLGNIDNGLHEVKEIALQNKPIQPEKLNSLISDVTRIKNIAGTLVNFTNAASSEIIEFSLIECANKAVKISNYSYPNNVKIVIKSPETPIPSIRSNPRQVEQVIFNLLINSFEALENSTNPEVLIESFSEHSYCGFHISHNGEKIASEEKFWEPMFTRNKSGNITSLGLTVCREIIQMYGGDIFLDEDGDKTVYSVVLPIRIIN